MTLSQLMCIRNLLAALAFCLFASPARAQIELYRFEGTASHNPPLHYLNPGDVDGDAVDDILITDRAVGFRLISGGLGTELLVIPWPDPTIPGWNATVIGDFDGDGVPDIALSSIFDGTMGKRAGVFRIHSVRDGAVLFEAFGSGPGARYGGSIRLGDIDADGVDDFAVTSLGMFGNNASFSVRRIEVRSGATADVLHIIDAPSGAFIRPSAGFGDQNGDGHDDLLVKLSRSSGGSVTQVIKVLSGINTDVLLTIQEPGPGEFAAASVRSAGDVDGDGVPDIVTHTPTFDDDRGLVTVLSGADGTQLRRYLGPPGQTGSRFGQSLVAGEDLNGDGLPDMVVGAWLFGATDHGAAFAYDLTDPSPTPIVESFGAGFQDFHGVALSILGDLDGDGAHEYAVGSSGADGTVPNNGLIQIFSLGEAVTVVSFDEDAGASALLNGQPLGRGMVLPGGVRVLGTGAGVAGAAVFDSNPAGPNANSSDPDLLVDRGTILILQDDPTQIGGLYANPGDSASGGTLTFAFSGPSAVRSIDLIDICPAAPPQGAQVRLIDTSRRSRRFDVPGGFTSDITSGNSFGTRRLYLSSLEDQVGVSATAVAQEDAGFDASSVVRIQVTLQGSGAIGELRFIP